MVQNHIDELKNEPPDGNRYAQAKWRRFRQPRFLPYWPIGWGFCSSSPGQALACQLDPGLGLTVPPPIRLFPFISQIEAWPLVF